MKKRTLLIILLALVCTGAWGKGIKNDKPTNKGLRGFYRVGAWLDRYLQKDIDTSYIALPEHSWRLAFTTAMVGINSTVTNQTNFGTFAMQNKSIPSVDLGFHAGYRSLGFGYSWDALNSYSRRLNFSLGSKFIGLDFSLQKTNNIDTRILMYGQTIFDDIRRQVTITNANLNIWYALNAAHYSHNAAIKQSYLQKRTAGSLLVHISYMSSEISISDSLRISGAERPLIPALMSNMTGFQTRQFAAGIGYGINYTPNHGKVILHASAAAMLVAYTVNHISYFIADSITAELPSGEPMYRLQPAIPVHVTGNVRAAVSWEINEWVHLSACATGDHIRFQSAPTAHGNVILLSNWNWKAQIVVGVRLGAGRERVRRALGDELDKPIDVWTKKNSRLPDWLTGYFWSPKN